MRIVVGAADSVALHERVDRLETVRVCQEGRAHGGHDYPLIVYSARQDAGGAFVVCNERESGHR